MQLLFNNAVGLVVPTTVDTGFIKYWLKVLAYADVRCQGATALQGLGYWKETDEVEQVFYIFTCCSDAQEGVEILRKIWEPIRVWATKTKQDSVALIRNGGLEIVPSARYTTYSETL